MGRAADRFGDDLYREVAETFVVEESGWAAEMAVRATDRLNGVRSGAPLATAVVWLARTYAFTMPGRRIYVSRELLSRGLGELGLAFIIAHEMAHHDLGHLDVAGEWLEVDAGGDWSLAGLLVRGRVIWNAIAYRPDQELAADLRGLEICRAAGYGDEGASQAFNLLGRMLLDHGDVDAVIADESEPEQTPLIRLLDFIHRTGRTHPPISDRLQALFGETGGAPPAALMVRPGAATTMVVACAACAVRFAPAARCPRCGSAAVQDLRRADERRAFLTAYYSRALRPPRFVPGPRAVAVGTAAATIGFIVHLLLGGSGLIDALAGGALVGTIIFLFAYQASRIARDSVSDALWNRKAPALELVPGTPQLEGPEIAVRGRVHVVKPATSPVGGRRCAAWRIIGTGLSGAVDDAGVGTFELRGEDGAVRARCETESAFVDVPVTGEPAEVRLTPELTEVLRARGAVPSRATSVRLAEAVIDEGDEVEVAGPVETAIVSDGLRGSSEIPVFRAWPAIRRAPDEPPTD
jgi:hypothetical protein